MNLANTRKLYRTRFAELSFGNIGPGLWVFFDISGDRPSQVGPHYHSKAELLADLTRYATDFGATEGA